MCMNGCCWPVRVCTDRFNKSSVLVSNIGSIHPEPGELVTEANNCIKSLFFSAVHK